MLDLDTRKAIFALKKKGHGKTTSLRRSRNHICSKKFFQLSEANRS